MGVINIDDETLEMWKNHYEKQDKIKYPNLKNFTIQKLRELIENNKNI